MMIDRPPGADFLESTKRYLDLPSDPQARLREFADLKQVWGTKFRRLLKNPESGDSETWYALGHGYRNGWGTERDQTAAEAWFRRAAEAGHVPAMVRLALILKHPDRESNWKDGIAWLERAAGLGDSAGMVHLGFAYREGQGVVADPEEAAMWFIKAYEAGDKHATIHAGRVFSAWLNRPEEAVHWFHLAAEANQSESYINLAMIFDNRQSELFAPEKAFYWYQEAVEQGGSNIPRAMLALARCHRDGSGVPTDKAKSQRWIERLLEATPESNEFHREGLKLRDELEYSFL